MERLIYDTADFNGINAQTIQKVNRAVVAAAIKIRDDVRQTFVSDAQSLYRHHTGNIENLTTGIMIGKDRGGSIKIHAMGSREDYESFKTRFLLVVLNTEHKKREMGDLSDHSLRDIQPYRYIKQSS